MKRKKKRIFKVLLVLIILIILINFTYKTYNKINNNTLNNYNTSEFDYSKYNTYSDVSILQYEEGTIKERLNLLSKQDKRINDILNNYNNYPENLLEALSRNVELTSFVLNYSQKKNKVYSDNIGTLPSGIVELFQWDERWGYASYGKSNIAISGCGPTALSMIAASLNNDNTITPYKVAQMAEKKGYYIEGVGTTWNLITEGSKVYNLKVKELPLSESVIYNSLNLGHPIICSMRKGDFTINGHYIVLTKIEDGKIKVNDPNSKIRSNILWDYDRIKGQIKNLWEISK